VDRYPSDAATPITVGLVQVALSRILEVDVDERAYLRCVRQFPPVQYISHTIARSLYLQVPLDTNDNDTSPDWLRLNASPALISPNSRDVSES